MPSFALDATLHSSLGLLHGRKRAHCAGRKSKIQSLKIRPRGLWTTLFRGSEIGIDEGNYGFS